MPRCRYNQLQQDKTRGSLLGRCGAVQQLRNLKWTTTGHFVLHRHHDTRAYWEELSLWSTQLNPSCYPALKQHLSQENPEESRMKRLGNRTSEERLVLRRLFTPARSLEETHISNSAKHKSRKRGNKLFSKYIHPEGCEKQQAWVAAWEIKVRCLGKAEVQEQDCLERMWVLSPCRHLIAGWKRQEYFWNQPLEVLPSHVFLRFCDELC